MFEKSNELLRKAEELIPLASQTFSKSKNIFPKGASPFFAERAKGCILIDVDGNEYIDYSMALCSTLIGYADPRINKAVRKQLDKGSIYSLANELEIEVAEKIIEAYPSIEMVRFGKNGSDATTGAVRLARHYTKRDYIIKFNKHYHGWHSWSIYHVNALGVTNSEHEHTLLADYNNLDSVEAFFKAYPNKIAAVIMEPLNIEIPKDNFLHKVKDLAHKNNALFVLDEVITGGRFSRGGAQQIFNIQPDLTCLGKGLANGFPLSAIGGKKEIMQHLEQVHFSFTFGGDCVALAAASATLDILAKADYNKYYDLGDYLFKNTEFLLNNLFLSDYIQLNGFPTWSIFTFASSEIKTYFLQECFKNGILTTGSHNLSFSHNFEHVRKTLKVYFNIFDQLSAIIHTGKNIKDFINCEIVEPVYKVR